MSKTVKFAVSMPDSEFKDLESLRRKERATRSHFIRQAVRFWKAKFKPLGIVTVKEDPGQYKTQTPMDLANQQERRRRAIAAAGRFCSGVADLSLNHDRYLEDAYAGIVPEENEDKKE
ncbi:MAG: CopG family transcriptional regulator [Candidatus Aminicenantes bacterium]|nr:CopG family transcriptional regulator [Candidatus Aminicenantes bacterium]